MKTGTYSGFRVVGRGLLRRPPSNHPGRRNSGCLVPGLGLGAWPEGRIARRSSGDSPMDAGRRPSAHGSLPVAFGQRRAPHAMRTCDRHRHIQSHWSESVAKRHRPDKRMEPSPHQPPGPSSLRDVYRVVWCMPDGPAIAARALREQPALHRAVVRASRRIPRPRILLALQLAESAEQLGGH